MEPKPLSDLDVQDSIELIGRIHRSARTAARELIDKYLPCPPSLAGKLYDAMTPDEKKVRIDWLFARDMFISSVIRNFHEIGTETQAAIDERPKQYYGFELRETETGDDIPGRSRAIRRDMDDDRGPKLRR